MNDSEISIVSTCLVDPRFAKQVLIDENINESCFESRDARIAATAIRSLHASGLEVCYQSFFDQMERQGVKIEEASEILTELMAVGDEYTEEGCFEISLVRGLKHLRLRKSIVDTNKPDVTGEKK
ncbi:hypothetical protein [Pelagicoccus sp. SDUM812003]|uniref:hypothetical protein n=1 Tax=Pelagicoccus sp. SDUM812003 TaxID=3041267 RepID=UPI00280EB72A|nr:hypothetical protein [Pelagicoccus sp. SDUM812003]MDQ8202786.1 hypothetical protein [Pelagicoccus sp. SDUM812003]